MVSVVMMLAAVVIVIVAMSAAVLKKFRLDLQNAVEIEGIATQHFG